MTFNQRVVSSNLTIFTIYSYRLMDKPSGYGPDIAGSSPAGSTIYGLLSQSVEKVGSNPIKFRFESEVTHQYIHLVLDGLRAVLITRYTLSDSTGVDHTWGLGLHEVVASLAPRKTGGFDSHNLHHFIGN